MYCDESFLEFNDSLPRNAPKPISTLAPPPKLAQPLVPEVSLILGLPNPPVTNFIHEKKTSAWDLHPSIRYNNINPPTPTAVVPEVSLIIPQSSQLATIRNCKSDGSNEINFENLNINQQFNSKSPTIQTHSSTLPIKIYSSFKRHYGSQIPGLENCISRNSRSSPTTSTINFQKISSGCRSQYPNVDANVNEFKRKLIESISNSDLDLISDQFDSPLKNDKTDDKNLFSILSKQLDEVTNVVSAMSTEMKELRTEFSQLQDFIREFLKTSCNRENSSETDEISQNNLAEQQCYELTTSKDESFIEHSFSRAEDEIISNDTKFKEDQNERAVLIPNKNHPNSKSPQSFPQNKKKRENILREHIEVKDQVHKLRKNNFRKHDSVLDTLPENSPLVLQNDRSLTMNNLAEKYLPEDKYKIYVNQNKNTGAVESLEPDKPNMSMGTYDYMKKYKLLSDDSNNNRKENMCNQENILFFQDFKLGPKFS